jgi:superfamily I DNA/RNA helicase
MQSLYFDHPEQIKTEDLRGLESFEDLQEIMAMEEDEFGEWTSRDRLIHSLGGYGRFTNELDSLEQESRRNEKNPKAAVVITAHKAKGLEYPSVTIGSDFVRKFTVSEEQEARTGIKYAINGGEIEEQNLLYVAVTRGMRSVDLREVEPLFPNRSVVGLPLPA